MENKGQKIKKTVVMDLIEQNKLMRELLEDWPAREIMMDYEKEWNEKRQDFFQKYLSIDFNVS